MSTIKELYAYRQMIFSLVKKDLRGRYKAVVEFVGGSAGELRVISGKFISDKPDYPVPVPDTKPDDQQPSTESKSG